MSQQPKVYLCLSGKSSNNPLIHLIVEKLTQQYQCNVFNPTTDIHAGDIWFETTIREIKDSDVLLVIIDQNAAESDWVRREVDIARGANVSIFPVRFADSYSDITAIMDKLALNSMQYHVFDDNLAGIESLYAAIQRHMRQTRAEKRRLSEDIFKPMFGEPSLDPQFRCDVFMVMPFAERFQPIYDDHIVPTVKSLQLSIKRGDDFFANHAIMMDIWSALFASSLVIADCTGKNPNVFYELGIAHTIGRPVILIAQDIDDIPFDLRHLRIIVYEYTPPGVKKLESKLSDAIQKLI